MDKVPLILGQLTRMLKRIVNHIDSVVRVARFGGWAVTNPTATRPKMPLQVAAQAQTPY